MIRVLIVDDDPMVASLHQRAIEALPGFTVVGVASNGREALRMAAQEILHLIVLDIYMPEMDGIEMLRQLRTLRYPVDVILITAARETEQLREATRYGAIDFIIKPFKLTRLQEALRTYAERFRTLHADNELSQTEVDKLLHQDESEAGLPQVATLPKGLNELTLSKVQGCLQDTDEAFSAEEVAGQCGVSRITARRYLEYLVETGQARVDLSYGAGRPSRQYSLRR